MIKADNLPWSKELELAVLCHCLLNPESVEEIIHLLKPEHFYSEAHRAIFSNIVGMAEAKRSIDLPNLLERLQAGENIELAGGYSYVASLADFSNCSIDYHGDCMIIKRYAMLRAMTKAFVSGQVRAMQGTDDPADISRGTIKFLQQLELELLSDSSTKTERDNAVEMCASLETASRAVAVTGIQRLDDDLGGFRAGELIVIAAESGVGKTVAARQIRRESCIRGVHGLYCSGEMDGEQLSEREAAARTGISLHKIRNPWKMQKQDFGRVLDFASMECDKCAVLSANLSVSRITAAANEMRRRGHLGFLIVDYDELVDAAGSTELEKQNNVVRGCKALAMSHHVPVVLLSQLRKIQQGEKADKPSIHRLYGGGGKVKNASTILFIDRPYVRNLSGDETASTIYLIKNRNGKVGQLACRFNITRMRFTEDEGFQVP